LEGPIALGPLGRVRRTHVNEFIDNTLSNLFATSPDFNPESLKNYVLENMERDFDFSTASVILEKRILTVLGNA
jgi:hypothetical protein